MRLQPYVGLIGILLLVNASTCARKSLSPRAGDVDVDVAKTVRFCELITQPEQYNNQVIQTEAILYSDRENTALYSPDCVGREKYVWSDFEPGYQYRDESVRRKFEGVDCPQPRCPSTETKVTVVGRFEGPGEQGFGHLGAYRFRFVIMQIVTAEPVS